MRREVVITLDSGSMGRGSDEVLFRGWVDFVRAHIARVVSPEIRVRVRSLAFAEPANDEVLAADERAADAVRAGVAALWDEWLRLGAPPAPVRCADVIPFHR